MATKTIKIVQGQDATVTVQLTDRNLGQPFSLVGLTGALAYFPAASGGAIAASGELVSADLGRLRFELNEVFTAAMNPGTEQDIEIQVDQGAQRTIAQILGKLEVAERLFGTAP